MNVDSFKITLLKEFEFVFRMAMLLNLCNISGRGFLLQSVEIFLPSRSIIKVTTLPERSVQKSASLAVLRGWKRTAMPTDLLEPGDHAASPPPLPYSFSHSLR